MHERSFSCYPDPVSDAFLIHNPAAGARDRGKEVGRVAYLLSKCITRFKVCQTEGPGHATLLALQAKEQGYSHILVAGGDGTLREAAAGAVNSDLDLTLLPIGSEEMGRRVFKTPQNLLQAASVLFNGRVQLVDTGTVNGELFIFNAGVGADADVVHGVQKPGFKKDGHGLKVYFTQAKNILPRVRGVSAKLIMDEETFFTPNLYQFWAINARMLARLRVTNGEIDNGEFDILLGFADRLS
jgi:diacylglycerol kinase family enzyme